MTKKKSRVNNRKKGNKPLKENKIKLIPLGRVGEILFYSALMFTLGVLTGRGTAPVHFEVKHDRELKALLLEEAESKPFKVKLGFHDELPQDGEIRIDESLVKKYEKIPVKSPRFQKDKKRGELFYVEDDKGKGVELKGAKETETAKPEKNRTIEKAVKKEDYSFSIQVAALKERTDADILASKIKASGFPAYSVSGATDKGETWYRVRVGKCKTREEAEEIRGRLLEKLNISGYLLKID